MYIQKFAVICVAAFTVAVSLKAQSSDTDAQAKAREALRQKISELNNQPEQSAPASATVPPAYTPPAATAPAAVAPAPEPVPAQPPVKLIIPPAATATDSSPSPASQLSPEDQTRVLQALRATKAQLDAAQPAVDTTTKMPVGRTTVNTMPPSATTMPSRGMTAPSPSSPAAPVFSAPIIAGSKQQRLDELLQLYKSDQITPAQYHEQRAKIVAEPGE